MILASHISFSDDGTAWLVRPGDNASEEAWYFEDRPCDTCHGDGYASDYGDCPDCDGTGRHTFTIEVDVPRITMWDANARRTFRVSVVPGMVLPIVADVGRPVPSETHIRITGGGIAWLAERIDGGGWRHTEITLPPDAKPGMWAVKLAVSNRAGGGGA